MRKFAKKSQQSCKQDGFAKFLYRTKKVWYLNGQWPSFFQVTIQPIFDHLNKYLTCPVFWHHCIYLLNLELKPYFVTLRCCAGASAPPPRAALGLALIFKRLIAGKGWHVWAGIKNIYHNSSGCRSKYLLWIKHVEKVSNVCHGRFDFVLEELDVFH